MSISYKDNEDEGEGDEGPATKDEFDDELEVDEIESDPTSFSPSQNQYRSHGSALHETLKTIAGIAG